MARVRPEVLNFREVISARVRLSLGRMLSVKEGGAGRVPTLFRLRGSQNSTVPMEVPNASRLWLSSAIAPVLTLPVFMPPCRAPPPADVKSSPPTSTAYDLMNRPTSRFSR